jgi:arsenate reductase (glutaredoxin)
VFTIYHNPGCSKSRAALGLLQEHGIDPRVILYLETPPSIAELTTLLDQLALPPRSLIRRSEPQLANVDVDALSHDELLQLMTTHPILIERPIVVRGERAIMGRPPERVLELL